jgi:CheY-like chemotaxis protein
MTKIMLVEDDNNLREIYEARLLAEGYEIVSAKDGEEALAIAVKEKPDLIISDVMMPKISGFDMLDILRSTPETKDTKVIMMTALSQVEDKQRADRLGADRYLVKSQVTLEDVAKVAREVIDQVPAGQPGSTPVDSPATTASPAPAAPAQAAQPPVSVPPAQPVATPTAQPATVTTPIDPAQSATPIPVTVADAPAPATTQASQPTQQADTTPSVDQQINQFLAQVPGSTPAPAPQTTAAPAPVAPTQPIAAPTAGDGPTVKQDTSGGKRILQPIHDISTAPVDLNALLAKEQAPDNTANPAIITPTQPPAA